MKNRKTFRRLGLRAGIAALGTLTMGFILTSCGSNSGSGIIPAITPIVKAATPSGFGGSASNTAVVELEKFYEKLQGGKRLAQPRFTPGFPGEIGGTPLDVSQIYSRFFGGSSGTGPTQIFSLLPQVDSRMASLTSNNSSCLSGTPIKYTLTPAGGATVNMYAQCYSTVSGQSGSTAFTNSAGVTDPQFYMIGKDTNGVYYLFEAVGAEWLAATETPLTGSTTNYSVHLWMGVGYGNGATGSGDGQCTQTGLGGQTGYDDCSYGVLEMIANAQIVNGVTSSVSNFEFTAAGTGLGYAGIQVISDGAYIYAVGSPDMGSTPVAVENLCLSATSTSNTTTYASPTLVSGTSINNCTVTPTCAAADATAGRCIAVNTTTGFALTPIGRETASSAPNGYLAGSCYPGPGSSQGSNPCTNAYYSASGSFGVNVTGMPVLNNMQMLGTATDSLYFANGPIISGNSSFSSVTSPISAAWAAAAGVTKFN